MFDFGVLYKAESAPDGPFGVDDRWDLFISAYTCSDRAKRLYERVVARKKSWLVFSEYGFSAAEYPTEPYFAAGVRDEAEYVRCFWDTLGGDAQKLRICIDTTGFIRPYLIFLVRWLYDHGVRRFHAMYAEPDHYKKRERTAFSGDEIREVRQVAGFEGIHIPDNSHDVLILGLGYDDHLISAVAEDENKARKVQLYGFPSLRADMYQENVLRVRAPRRPSAQVSVTRANVITPLPTIHLSQQASSKKLSRDSKAAATFRTCT